MSHNDRGPGVGTGAAGESSSRNDSIGLADIIQLAWESGRDYQPEGLAELYDDAVCSSIAPPKLTHEERVQMRVLQMEQWALKVREQITAEAAGEPRQPWGCS